MVGTVTPRSIDTVVDDVTRAVIENGGRPLPYFVVEYGRWMKALGQYRADRHSLGLTVKECAETSVRNFLVAGVPVVFERPR